MVYFRIFIFGLWVGVISIDSFSILPETVNSIVAIAGSFSPFSIPHNGADVDFFIVIMYMHRDW